MSPTERRRFPRIIHSFLIRYQSPTAQGMAWRMAPLKDLSMVGTRFLCERLFAVGEKFEVELVIPAFKHPIGLTARVVWSRLVNRELHLFECGVAFAGMTEPVRQQLEQAVNALLAAQ